MAEADTFEAFTRCGNMQAAMRAHLRTRMLALGPGGNTRLADEADMAWADMSQMLGRNPVRNFSWSMADRIVAALDRVEENERRKLRMGM